MKDQLEKKKEEYINLKKEAKKIKQNLDKQVDLLIKELLMIRRKKKEHALKLDLEKK